MSTQEEVAVEGERVAGMAATYEKGLSRQGALYTIFLNLYIPGWYTIMSRTRQFTCFTLPP